MLLALGANLGVALLKLAAGLLSLALRERFGVLGEIFLQPVPRSDQRLRQRVLSRYGAVLADE